MSYADQRIGVDEWYYVPEMRRGEAVVFKQYDSAAPLDEHPEVKAPLASPTEPSSVRAAFTLHTSFRETSANVRRKPARRSIEYRVLVFEDEEGVLPDSFGQAAMQAIAETAAMRPSCCLQIELRCASTSVRR